MLILLLLLYYYYYRWGRGCNNTMKLYLFSVIQLDRFVCNPLPDNRLVYLRGMLLLKTWAEGAPQTGPCNPEKSVFDSSEMIYIKE